VTVFVSSHLLSEIEMISEYLVMLRKGEVIFFGKTIDLLHRSRPVIVARPESTSDLVKLKNLVDSAGHPAVIDGDALRVDAGEDWSADLNRLAFENNILLRQLTPVRPNLEETFFEMTEER